MDFLTVTRLKSVDKQERWNQSICVMDQMD